MGALALALLVTAELPLAVLVQDRSLGECIADRDPVSGGVYVAMLAAYAAMPSLALRHGVDAQRAAAIRRRAGPPGRAGSTR